MIFDYYRNGKLEKAAASMAKTDYAYGKMLKVLEKYNQDQIQKQKNLALQHQKKLNTAWYEENLFLILILCALLIASYYSFQLIRYARRSNESVLWSLTIKKILHDAEKRCRDESSQDGIISSILTALSESEIFSLSIYWQWNKKKSELKYQEGFSDNSGEMSLFLERSRQVIFKAGEGLPGRVFEKNEVSWISSISQDSNFPRKSYAIQAGLVSGFAIPVLIDGQVIGVIEAFSKHSILDAESLSDELEVFVKFVDSKFIKLRLQATENEKDQILQAINSTAIVATTDVKGKILDVNDKFCEISGYSREELIGKTHRIVNSGAHPKVFFKEMWQTLLAGQTWTGDIENRSKNGDPYFVRTVITPILNQDAKVIKMMAIRFDLTGQRKIERQLIEAQSISKIGSWTYDLRSSEQVWTSENYKIFEIEEGQCPEVLYQLYRERVHPDDIERLDTLIERAKNYGEDFVYNHRVVLDSGQRIKFVQGIGKVTCDESGKPIFISGTCQDQTEMMLQQIKQRQLAEFNSAIIHSAKFAIITTDLNGIINTFNDEAEKILGYRADELIGQKSPRIFYDTHELEEAARQFSLVLGIKVGVGFETFIANAVHGEYDERDWTFVTKSGSRVPVRLIVSGLYGVSGELEGYIGIARDMTEQIELQKQIELERVKSTHNAKLASLGEMSAGIAHEINNPLAIITGNTKLLKRMREDEVRFESKVEQIIKATSRIEKIVKGLKKFSRSTVGTEYKVHGLDHIISESLIITEAKAKRHDVNIKLSIESELCIYCDEVEIEQVIVNLINNGVDAIKNTEDRWLEIKAFSTQDRIVLQIIDSGHGISDEIEKKLFQPFFTTKGVGEGTGLGLSITKGILDQHEATIELNKTLGNTCFELKFPKPREVQSAA